jgi:nucleoside 2-deoxyribosyltransferase
MKPEVHVYLAGPDVFLPDPIAIGARKKSMVAAKGMHGHFPFDNEVHPEPGESPEVFGLRIGHLNEKMMLNCCKPGRIGIILANMTPWHGSPSMDVGTAHEVGFMSALAEMKGNVIVIGYYEKDALGHLPPADLATRVKDWMKQAHPGQAFHEKNGMTYGPDGTMIEDFGLAENLMIVNAIRKTGGDVCYSFEEAVTLARLLADERMKMTSRVARAETPVRVGWGKALA